MSFAGLGDQVKKDKIVILVVRQQLKSSRDSRESAHHIPPLYLVVPLLFETLLKASDSLPQGVNVSVEHRDGHGSLIWLCMDTAASPEVRQTCMSTRIFLFYACRGQPICALRAFFNNMHLLRIKMLSCICATLAM